MLPVVWLIQQQPWWWALGAFVVGYVLQFAGHGDERGGLFFEDGRGAARRVTPAELAKLVQGKVKLLLTGACYSAHALAALFPPGDQETMPGMAAIAVDGEHPIETRAVQLFTGAFSRR